jgi:dTDP-4-dehydrorhamnose reductase
VRPDAVVHTASVQHGQDSEATIVAGTANVAGAGPDVRLVHVSTDMVFGGRPAPYGVDDAPDPIDEYGRAKATAEEMLAGHERAVVVRPSLLYSIERPCPAVAMVLEARTECHFFVDEYRCPTLVEDLAAGLVALAASTETGVVHLNAPEAVSRFEFARLVAAHYGVAVSEVQAGRAADHATPRPGRVVLVPSAGGYRGVRDVLTPRSS